MSKSWFYRAMTLVCLSSLSMAPTSYANTANEGELIVTATRTPLPKWDINATTIVD